MTDPRLRIRQDDGRGGARRDAADRSFTARDVAALLFLALNQNLHFGEREVAIAFDMVVADDPASTVLSAVVLSDDFRARDFRVWVHPKAKRPLSDAVQEELRRVLSK